jgi:hypothetical protein
MARSKSISGGKASRVNTSASTSTSTSKEQTGAGNPANIPDMKAVAAESSPAEIAPETETRIAPEPRKLEVVKTEPRKNVVVPINRTPINLEDEIRRRAYELYLQRGNSSGSEAEDWLTAEREVRQRHRQQQSA